MNTGHFYYIEDQYFLDFQDSQLMKHKETVDGILHNRPCFYAFEDSRTGLYWMIPISSQLDKFREHQRKKILKYGTCDTIVFGNVLGYEKAFLIQNMCPVTKGYIDCEYIEAKTNLPVRVDGSLENEIITKAKKALALQRKGVGLIFPDVLKIESMLLK